MGQHEPSERRARRDEIELRGEVLVFESGSWRKSAELYRDIRGATFDDLILAGSLKEDLRRDLQRFVESRAIYERLGVAWRRGVLLLGPPGNGKTHCVKALVNLLGLPTLYVAGFDARFDDPSRNVRRVFERARRMAPCVLVLEDLDALVGPKTRSCLLNELDGFAANTGILTVATTTHPGRLDPALLERPSRFDMKFVLDPPGPAERVKYAALWNAAIEESARLSRDDLLALSERTEGFSYAYIKELFVSSLLRVASSSEPLPLQRVVGEQTSVLREQMSRPKADPPKPEFHADDDDA